MKNAIGAIVAGILIMAWQTLSHTALQLHASQEMYTSNQDAILKALSENLSEKGQYYLPNVPPGTSAEEMEKSMEAAQGKPYASILYHPAMDMDMTMNILRGLLTNIVLAFVLVWLLHRLNIKSMAGVLFVCLSIAFIAFCFYPYPGYIWYQTNGIWIEMLDSFAAFGLAGLWLGWWMTRAKKV